MTSILYAVIVLGVLGAIFGVVLGIAAKVFAVEVDPREEAIIGCLPGANCGGCGFPGCGGYAAAVVAGKAGVSNCAAGGAPVAAQIAEIMGVSAGEMVKRVAQVHCTGNCSSLRYDYNGLKDCLAISRMQGGGPLDCKFACLGGGTCTTVCKFDAIHVVDGVAKVDVDKCTACGACTNVCPKNIIDLVPRKVKKLVAIPCSSQDKGVVTRKICDNGCIGCGLCAKACPKEAITITNNLAKIDYDKCIGCGICAQKCPRKLITVNGVVPAPKPAAPAPEAAAPEAPAQAQ